MRKHYVLISALALCLLFLSVISVAGEGVDLSVVYVTTQDNAALRAGPGRDWDRLAVLPFATTYRATGRTLDGQWIQVAYEGKLDEGARNEFTVDGVTYGWVVYWLLTWTGNILELPIDGRQFVPTAREAGGLLTLGPSDKIPIFIGEVIPKERVPNPFTSFVRVEITGRLGGSSSKYFWIQFKFNNHFYWVPNWAVGVWGVGGVPDAGYLYPYGRLLLQLRSELSRLSDVYNDIRSRWVALDTGMTATCNNIPADFELRRTSFNSGDLAREPLYQPLAAALENVQNSTNSALAKFRIICAKSDSDRLISPDEINAGLADIHEADINMTLIRTLLRPFAQRDPLLGQ
ncbi:MAG: hypothetical protein GC179_21415 [Anaerolineaceae bacterium]|nr:hypothetical protein [Anaerolineaceae bacterium]